MHNVPPFPTWRVLASTDNTSPAQALENIWTVDPGASTVTRSAELGTPSTHIVASFHVPLPPDHVTAHVGSAESFRRDFVELISVHSAGG